MSITKRLVKTPDPLLEAMSEAKTVEEEENILRAVEARSRARLGLRGAT